MINKCDNNDKIEYLTYSDIRDNLSEANSIIGSVFICIFVIECFLFNLFNIHTIDFKNFSGTIWIFIISLISLIVISFIIFFYFFDKKIKESQIKFLYAFYIFYLLIFFYYTLLLSNFIEYRYILLILLLILFDFLLIDEYYRNYESLYLLFIFSPIALFNIIIIAIYSYLFQEDSNIIRNIVLIAFGIMLYIIIINIATFIYKIHETIYLQCFIIYGIFLIPDLFLLSFFMCLVGIVAAIIEKIQEN